MLVQYPQRLVQFFSPGDAQIPKQLLRAAKPLPPPTRAAGLPVPAEKITVVVRSGKGTYWLGSHEGAMRCGPDASKRCDYFAGRRYLPDDDVVAIYPQSERFVWIRTKTGVARLEFRPMTLEQKAQAFEEPIRLRHNRYGLIATSHMTRAGDLSSNRMVPNDNDGLWSAIYIGAEAFRYAATHNPEAKKLARTSLDALMKLEQVTGIPGFPARAYIRRGDYRDPDGEWHFTPDNQFEWKGDTSSDEIVGHFFAYSVYYDHVAEESEKPAIRAVVSRIMDHILSHGRYLIGPSGKPTTWGKWSPAYFANKDGLGWCDSPLNSLELLSFIRATHHITGEQRYLEEYGKLVKEGYPEIAAKRLERRCELNYSDEELAMLSFYPLLEYEHGAELRKTYLDALEQWWDNEQREDSPLWIYIYDRATGKRVKLAEATQFLARHPMDLIEWTVRNSNRADLHPTSDKDRFRQQQFVELLPPDERPVMRWNSNPFRVDGGNGGRAEDDGAAYLLPYWMGRFYGYVL